MLGEQKELEKAKGKKGGKGSKNKSKRFPDKPTADVSYDLISSQCSKLHLYLSCVCGYSILPGT